MLVVEKITSKHLESIRKNPVEPGFEVNLSDEHIRHLVECPHNYAILNGAEVLVCGGVLHYWFGRAESWAVLSTNAVKHLFPIQRIVKDFLDRVPYSRVEASIQLDFEKGHKWVRALGFNLELAERRKFFPSGASAALYSRVK